MDQLVKLVLSKYHKKKTLESIIFHSRTLSKHHQSFNELKDQLFNSGYIFNYHSNRLIPSNPFDCLFLMFEGDYWFSIDIKHPPIISTNGILMNKSKVNCLY